MTPFTLFGMNPAAAGSIAGVIASLLACLAGLIALFKLVREMMDTESAFRAVFYLLIFPSAFIMGMVYTESLFIAVSLWVLLLSYRKKWVLASILAAIAVWVRAQGAVLALPLGIAWLMNLDFKKPLHEQLTKSFILQGVLVLLPVFSFIIWRVGPMGQNWTILQDFWYHRKLLSFKNTFNAWRLQIEFAIKNGGQAIVYTIMDLSAVLIAVFASFSILKKYPVIAIYSLVLILVSAFSGSAESLIRYMLVVPAVYIALARFGKNFVFDKGWTILSILLFGVEAMLFTFKMWVG